DSPRAGARSGPRSPPRATTDRSERNTSSRVRSLRRIPPGLVHATAPDPLEAAENGSTGTRDVREPQSPPRNDSVNRSRSAQFSARGRFAQSPPRNDSVNRSRSAAVQRSRTIRSVAASKRQRQSISDSTKQETLSPNRSRST